MLKLNLTCQKFERLFNEQDERNLTDRESQFVDQHRCQCTRCRAFEESASASLGFLRDAALEPEISESFDTRVLRRIRVQTVRQGVGYWSPAFIAGIITCMVVLATLQVATAPGQLKKATLPEGEARIGGASEAPLPNLILDTKPRLR